MSLVVAGLALTWIKMGAIALPLTFCFAAFALLLMYSVTSIFCAIGGRQLVTGETKFVTPSGYFDLTSLQPGVGDASVLASYNGKAAKAKDGLV